MSDSSAPKRLGPAVHPVTVRLRRSPEFRSGLFALTFSPVALVLMGSSMDDIAARTATGLPLASVEGMIGMALGAVLLTLIAVNCDLSSSGLFVAAACSVPIGLLQWRGLLSIPGLFTIPVSREDLATPAVWSLHPLITTTILTGSAFAVWLTHRAGRSGKLRRSLSSKERPSMHQWIRALVATCVVPMTVLVFFVLIHMAPADATRVAAQGMSGLLVGHQTDVAFAIFCAVTLGLVALTARWSLFGPQLAGWALMTLPAYLFLPVWATLSGRVVAPGDTTTTQVSLAAPIIALLGMVLGSSTLGVHWARRKWLPVDEDPAEDAPAPPFESEEEAVFVGEAPPQGAPVGEVIAVAEDGGEPS
ncbi:hypothetical protein I6B53_00810 [Schaalia sp. 19OD2882]|uniref:hypothetical protein n=1 Tax=Schaalia sp. 19OD2882 TaxID=2794089 RepID=UPI001C1EC57F|nr:hypothetical protein [Schaalia sp. 19OD2882]QWW19716.1 hypothetical protein I6B53_00810 [Schaalia sp. 19OD2882]